MQCSIAASASAPRTLRRPPRSQAHKHRPLQAQRVLHDLHALEHLLLLELAPDDLHAERQPVHPVRVVHGVRGGRERGVLRGAREVRGERVERAVDFRHGEDTGGVVELYDTWGE
jgi:hypothetical protein